jgi:Cys-rich protein (TIGR01571 family)
MSHWSTNICDGCNSPTCWCACVLPCFVFAQNVKLMQEKGMNQIPVVDECGCSNCNKSACAGTLYALGLIGGSIGGNSSSSLYPANALTCLSVYIHSRVRGIIRKKNGIGHDCCGDECSDFCCALWCFSCAMAQEQKMLEKMSSPNPSNSMFNGVRIEPSVPEQPQFLPYSDPSLRPPTAPWSAPLPSAPSFRK